MNIKEFVALGLGTVGILSLRVLYENCPPLINAEGNDARLFYFIFGLALCFFSAFIIGTENWR